MVEEIPAYVLADGKAYLHSSKSDVYEGYWGAKTSSVKCSSNMYDFHWKNDDILKESRKIELALKSIFYDRL